MYSLLTEPRLRDIQREYVEILERDDAPQRALHDKVREMVSSNEGRLVISINQLRSIAPLRAANLLNNGCEELLCLQQALKRVACSIDPSSADRETGGFYVGVSGNFGEHHLNPRTLVSSFLGKMVCVEGIVTKCSLVCPKLLKSVHYCPATKKVLQKVHADSSSLDPFPVIVVYPTKDDDGNLFETEYGLCKYENHQTCTIQEMPENAPPGQLPRSVDVIAEADLVDRCKAGDRVRVIGIYQSLPQPKTPYTSSFFRTSLIANNVIRVTNDLSEKLEPADISLMRSFAKKYSHSVFEILSRSLAPSIQGHENVKKAILCLILGGVEKHLANGSRLRGDINLLLIGDPSVAKSQLLRYVLHVAPIAVCTTGRGSSGVGLTASVTSDQETGERRLEGGAMVIADRGVVCIDEFDKMTDIDRTAIHEVMEQGRVTIAKAGIHATLNARCSVLAAANPIYGRYDRYRTPMENIGLPDSLLSRFDVIFVMLDNVSPELDKRVADHVLKIHQYRPVSSVGMQRGGGGGGAEKRGAGDAAATAAMRGHDSDLPIYAADRTRIAYEVDEHDRRHTTDEPAAAETDDEDGRQCCFDAIFEKDESVLNPLGLGGGPNTRIVNVEFFKKYVRLARSTRPVLTRKASDAIAKEYVNLRNYDTMTSDERMARTQPITVRTLETLIRIATAHAKCRLSRFVSEADATAAIQLVQYAIFKKVLQKPKRKKPGEPAGGSHPFRTDSTTTAPEDGTEVIVEDDGEEEEEEEDETDEPNRNKRPRQQSAEVVVVEVVEETLEFVEPASHVIEQFRSALADFFRFGRQESFTVAQVQAHMKQLVEDDKLAEVNERQIVWILRLMDEEGMIMFSNETVYLL